MLTLSMRSAPGHEHRHGSSDDAQQRYTVALPPTSVNFGAPAQDGARLRASPPGVALVGATWSRCDGTIEASPVP